MSRLQYNLISTIGTPSLLKRNLRHPVNRDEVGVFKPLRRGLETSFPQILAEFQALGGNIKEIANPLLILLFSLSPFHLIHIA